MRTASIATLAGIAPACIVEATVGSGIETDDYLRLRGDWGAFEQSRKRQSSPLAMTLRHATLCGVLAMVLLTCRDCVAAGSANGPGTTGTISGNGITQTALPGQVFGYVLGTSAVARAEASMGTSTKVEKDARIMFNVDAFYRWAVWRTNFWLWGVKGIAASSVGCQSDYQAIYAANMISPRHCLFVAHVRWRYDNTNLPIRFIGTDNVGANANYTWARCLGSVIINNDVCVGLMDRDLPETVGYYAVLPKNFAAYTGAGRRVAWQGIGYSQDRMSFSQSVFMTTSNVCCIQWEPQTPPLHGLSTNWGHKWLRSGDSSNPVRLLVGDQLVLVSMACGVQSGPVISAYFDQINAAMHHLSTNHHLASDYQLTSIDMSRFTPFK